MLISNLIEESDDTIPIDQSNIFDNIRFEALDSNQKGVLVTPSCDIAQEKTSYFHFCPLRNFELLFPKILEKELSYDIKELKKELSTTKKGKIIKKLIDYIGNNVVRYHWLGELPKDNNYWYIDYQITSCLKIENVTIDDRIAILKSPLKESVINQYSTYMGRVGLPWETKHKEKIAEEIIGDDKTISVSLKSICQDVRKGDRILLDDGKIVLESLGVEKNKLKALVIQGGEISSRKGMNLPDSKLSVPCLSEKDIADISFLVEMQAEWIALSFVRSAADIIELRHIISNLRLEHKPYIIAKIEKPEAIEDFDNILKETDGIMVARGDLGLEIPLEKLPLTQKMIIKKTNAQSKPVIIATQMMENMIYNIYPSRAEVNDVANSVMDGADALMLSAETSVGKYPVEVIQTMQRIISQVEDFEDIYYKHHQSKIKNNSRFITDSVLYTACSLAKDSEAKAIVAMTQSGYSAFKLSAQRPKAKIFIFTNNKAIINTLNLLWGVEAFYNTETEPWEPNITSLVDFSAKWEDMLDSTIPIPTPNSSNFADVLGLFEGAGYMAKSLYRPSYDCTMKSVKFNYFCPVCKKAIKEMIESYTN